VYEPEKPRVTFQLILIFVMKINNIKEKTNIKIFFL
tara:strand:- start:25295 stop:25402 length:108 start_codon:yes stop_codon:yes gene_type:complete